MKKKHYTGNEVIFKYSSGRVSIVLKHGETAWIPGTTKHWYRGPCTVRYIIHPDGGADATKVGGSTVPSDTPGA